MKARAEKLDPQSGVSYVELLVVIVIIAIVASLALLQRGSANEQFQRQNASRELKVAFERARFDSVKRRAVAGNTFASVIIDSDRFTLVTDNDNNGVTTDAGDSMVTMVPAGIIFAKYGSGSLPLTVTFNMRGETSSASAPQFYACNVNCSSPSNATADIVIITPTGTVNLLPGGATIPSFNNPSVSSVSTGSSINPDVILP